MAAIAARATPIKSEYWVFMDVALEMGPLGTKQDSFQGREFTENSQSRRRVCKRWHHPGSLKPFSGGFRHSDFLRLSERTVARKIIRRLPRTTVGTEEIRCRNARSRMGQSGAQFAHDDSRAHRLRQHIGDALVARGFDI